MARPTRYFYYKRIGALNFGVCWYALCGKFHTPGLIPVATLPELPMEWAEVFEGV